MKDDMKLLKLQPEWAIQNIDIHGYVEGLHSWGKRLTLA